MTFLLSVKSSFLYSTAPLLGVKKCNYEQHMTQSKFLQWHHMPEDTIPDNSCLYDVRLVKQTGNAYKGTLPFGRLTTYFVAFGDNQTITGLLRFSHLPAMSTL